MTTKIRRCDRCARRWRGQDDWNVIYRAGMVVGHRCPGCQTQDDRAEALINDATTDYTTVQALRPGDPGFHEAMVQHVVATADKVFDDFMQVAADSADGAAADPYALADETLRLLVQTMGKPRNEDTVRDDLAAEFRRRFGAALGVDEEA